MFSLIRKLSSILRTSMLMVLLTGNLRFTTVLDPSFNFFKMSNSSLPEYIFDNFFCLSFKDIFLISSFLI